MNDSQPAFIRHVKYAGSFVVVGDDLLSREHFVRQQLSTMRDMMSAEPVLLALSVSSITVYYEDSHSAFLCHSLRRVSCITCDSNHCQFAYVASDDRNSQTQCCHTFLTIHPWQADELNSTVAGVFHEAYVNRQLKKQRRAAAEVAGHGQTEDTGRTFSAQSSAATAGG